MWGVGCQVGEGEQNMTGKSDIHFQLLGLLVTVYSRQPSSMVTNEPLAFNIRVGAPAGFAQRIER